MPIAVNNLTYVYNPGTPFETRALDNISLNIDDGEFIGIIGHTGSGKSTLIQHLNALIKPTSGEVFVDGEDINESKNRARLRQRVGLVFQYPEYQLFEETVFKDVCFGPKNMGFDEAKIKQCAESALNTVGLSMDDWDKSPFELSGGQKRRAAIAGVLAMQPNVLILDEPAAGLDPQGRRDILTMIKQIHEAGTTIVMVSHSMDDVARLCSRIIVLENGKVAMDGSCEEVFSDANKLKSMGLMPPEAALLVERLNERGFELTKGIYTIEALSEALIKRLKKR